MRAAETTNGCGTPARGVVAGGFRPAAKPKGSLRSWPGVLGAALLVCWIARVPCLFAQQPGAAVPDLSGEYQFLNEGDTLGLLEEEGKLKGYVDVLQGEEESDEVLSYTIDGTRQEDQVEFKTSKIHEKYYRFTGKVERGKGRQPGDPDYARLVGDLQTISVDPVSGQEKIQHKQVVFKSKGKPPRDEP
jgi:hypothetical protein